MLAGLIVKFGSFWLLVSRPISATSKSLLDHQWSLIKVIIGNSCANCHDGLYKTAKAKSLRYQKGFMWLVVIVFVKWAYLDCTQSILLYFCFTLFFFFHFWTFALAKLGGGKIILGVYNVEIQSNSLILTLH